MALKQFEIDATLDEIRDRINANDKRIKQAEALLATASGDLNTMTAMYTAFVTQLNTDAAAAPADEVLQRAKEIKDKYVSEFQSLKTSADAKLAASQGA